MSNESHRVIVYIPIQQSNDEFLFIYILHTNCTVFVEKMSVGLKDLLWDFPMTTHVIKLWKIVQLQVLLIWTFEGIRLLP